MKNLKIGELAERTGLTVRTLRHYDNIGLLTPSERTDAGYRLYTQADIVRLQQITSLQSLGFSLPEIKACLEKPDFSPMHVLDLHVRRLKDQLKEQQRLTDQLESVIRLMSTKGGNVSADDFLQTIAAITRFQPQFTEEEMNEIKKRGENMGPEAIRAVEQEWPQLMAKVKAEMEAGTDPADPRVQALGKRWMELVKAFTGGNPEIEKKLQKAYEENAKDAVQFGGPDPAMMRYVQRVTEAMQRASSSVRAASQPNA